MCDCVEQINPSLAEHDAHIGMAHFINGRPSAPTVQLVRSSAPSRNLLKGTPCLICSYCPFCGDPLDPDEGANPRAVEEGNPDAA